MAGELQNYIKQMHEQGFSDEKVKEELIAAGWPQDKIDAEIKAFASATGTPSAEAPKAEEPLEAQEAKTPHVFESLKKSKNSLSKKALYLIIGGAVLLVAAGAVGALYSDYWNPSWDPFVGDLKNETEEHKKFVNPVLSASECRDVLDNYTTLQATQAYNSRGPFYRGTHLGPGNYTVSDPERIIVGEMGDFNSTGDGVRLNPLKELKIFYREREFNNIPLVSHEHIFNAKLWCFRLSEDSNTLELGDNQYKLEYIFENGEKRSVSINVNYQKETKEDMIKEQETLQTDDYEEAFAFVMGNIVDENSQQSEDEQFRFTHPIFDYSFTVPAGWQFELSYDFEEMDLTFEDDDLLSEAEINVSFEYGDNLLSEQEILDFFEAESIEEVYQDVGVEGDTIEEILFNETVNVDSIVFDPSQWEREEFKGLVVYEVTFDNESLAPLLAEEDPGVYAYVKKKFIIFDELNYVVMELPDFTIEGGAELYSEELSEEKINEIVDEIKLVFGSFQPGSILTDENLKILELHDRYWEYVNEVSERMVQAYNGYYEPTYFPERVLTDSAHIRSISASSSLDTVYDCKGGGSIQITQIVREDSISPEDAISTLDNGFVVYGEGSIIRVASPLGTRVVAQNFFDEEGSCELSDEELLKIIESM